jgi:hypothetical protein
MAAMRWRAIQRDHLRENHRLDGDVLDKHLLDTHLLTERVSDERGLPGDFADCMLAAHSPIVSQAIMGRIT